MIAAHRRSAHGRGRVALVAVSALVLAVLAAVTGIAIHYSNRILGPVGPEPLDSHIVYAVTDTTVELSRDADSERPGVYFMSWPGGGFGEVGRLLAVAGDRVTRVFQTRRGRPIAGGRAGWGPYPLAADPGSALGIPWSDVGVPSAIGPLPAWYMPGSDSVWVLFVHGRGATRAEALRVLPTFHGLGAPCLVLSFRNDGIAPRVGDGRYRMGAEEWQDVEAGVRYALSRGASAVALAGFSMGGGIVLEFLKRSPLATHVRAVLVDAPVLDWRETIHYNAKLMHIPQTIADLGLWAAARREGIDWDRLAQDAPGRALPMPTLLFHGEADPLVPFAGSTAFAAHHRDAVTFVAIPGAGHMRSWNANPAAYDSIVATWWRRCRGS